MRPSSSAFPKEYFQRYDESDDSAFYLYPRLTVHIDEGAIAAASALYEELLPRDGTLVDMHTFPVARLVGLGMNMIELEENPQLTSFIVQDLNRKASLPFADGEFDGAICTVSVQYLTQPVEVFAEVGRVLKEGAPFIVTFSNRCFPSKAVRIWTATDDRQHMELVRLYFEFAGCFTHVKAMDRSPASWLGDPLFAAVGYKSSPLLSNV
jgi:SAM-dependent methyltransferase